jgi:hypothetical protein
LLFTRGYRTVSHHLKTSAFDSASNVVPEPIDAVDKFFCFVPPSSEALAVQAAFVMTKFPRPHDQFP